MFAEKFVRELPREMREVYDRLSFNALHEINAGASPTLVSFALLALAGRLYQVSTANEHARPRKRT